MAKVTQAQLLSFLAASGVEIEDSANASVAPTATVRKVKAPAAPTSYTIKPGKYKGHDVVSFESDTARPFALGFNKLRVILHNADKLRKIVS